MNMNAALETIKIARRPGRPAKPGSKRTNPEYRPWSGLLRCQYVREAGIVLKQTADPRDMSDLITELLGNWVGEHKKEMLLHPNSASRTRPLSAGRSA